MVSRTSQSRGAGPEADGVASNLGGSANGPVMNRDWEVWESNHCLTTLCDSDSTGKQGLNSNLVQDKSIRQGRRDKQGR